MNMPVRRKAIVQRLVSAIRMEYSFLLETVLDLTRQHIVTRIPLSAEATTTCRQASSREMAQANQAS